ncbi:MAG: replicative DNA helicase [Candidatus Nomurabacteria bacterium]|jgi:replicative DNA helicase|nr:replicative DNA helicase [Candidatus Nomurabacteria bacterium]
MNEKAGNVKLPPQDIEAEMSLLGAVLIDDEVMSDVADRITAEEFYEPKHRSIFSAMVKLYDGNRPIDLLTLKSQLDGEKKLKEIGGRKYLTELASYVPTAANAAAYAEIIRTNATRRRYIEISTRIANLSFEGELDIKELSDQVESLVYHANSENVSGDLVSIEAIVNNTYETIEQIQSNPDKLRGVKTGYADLDKITAGLQKSDLIILAARPAMGKSTLAQNLAMNVAMKEKKAVLFFTLEMSQEQLVERMLSETAGVDNSKIRTGKLTGEEMTKIGNAMGEIAEAPIFIDQSSDISVLEMRTKARRLAHKQPLGLIIVDYLQLMRAARGNRDNNRVQEVGEISRGLKLLAREMDVPVVALSQLSRAVESRNPPIPMLSDLRESGSIEQDADIVMFMYREDYYDEDTDRKNITDLIISKHRNGSVGKVQLYFHPSQLKFTSYSNRQD